MAANDQGYNNFRIPIPKEFEEIFSHFYFAENNTEKPINKTLLPTYQTMIIFSLGTAVSITSSQKTIIKVDKCIILGPVKLAFDYLLPVGSEIFVVNFKADAFYRFFGNISLPEHLPVNPDEIFTETCFTDLWYDLKKKADLSERINHILDFCRPYIRNREPGSQAFASWNNSASTLNPIKVVAQQTNQTERTVQLNHKKYFGYSAKEINRYNRFLKAIELIQNIVINSSKVDWYEIIDKCGYYDQSQLIHDFKHFINITPKKFLKFQQEICYKKPE